MEFIIILQCLVIIVLLVVLLGKSKNGGVSNTIGDFSELKKDIREEFKNSSKESSDNTIKALKDLSEAMLNSQVRGNDTQNNRINDMINQNNTNFKNLESTLDKMVKGVDGRMSKFSSENELKLDNIRNTIRDSLKDIQAENSKKLDEMRNTVDEKLQKTLEDRIGQSFKIVSDRLEQVYKSLGEMQTLANGVGDLKKVLSNVKTRGILGEIQLGAILDEILSKEQYDVNVATVKGSKNVVEFAIKLPGNGDGTVYLPIDSKFPGDTYATLVDAYEGGDITAINNAKNNLIKVIKSSAKDIRDKYIEPPYTTDFGIMFLPFEGLYAEVVRSGLVEVLQRDYKVNVAGPTTMAALLNSLQMGFQTLAVQKRTSEVWSVLGAVKTEFDKFGKVLLNTQKRLEQANKELDELVGVRTRQIQRKLKNVTMLDESDSVSILNDVEEV